MPFELTLFLFDRNARPVTHVLVAACQSVKHSRLAAVRVAGKCDFNRHQFTSLIKLYISVRISYYLLEFANEY